MRSSTDVIAVATLAVVTLAAGLAAGCKEEQQPPKDAAVFDVSIELPEGCPPVQPNEKGPCLRKKAVVYRLERSQEHRMHV